MSDFCLHGNIVGCCPVCYRALEAELARAESDGRLLGKMLDAQNEKLYKAEARVKVLEADLARHQDGERTAK